MAFFVASSGGRPSWLMMRSTFSTTTMASSTTIPITSTMPNMVSTLMEKPSASNVANVPSKRHRHHNRRDDGVAEVLQEQNTSPGTPAPRLQSASRPPACIDRLTKRELS
jgi:hypothetical protein